LTQCLDALDGRYEHATSNYTAGQGSEFVLDDGCSISSLKAQFVDEWETLPAFGDIIIQKHS
jgi:hypothetical protein